MTGHGLRRRRAASVATLATVAALALAGATSPLAAQQKTTRRPAPAKRPAAKSAPSAAPPAPAVPLGRVAGVLEDSVRMEPLVGATVRVGATRRAVSDHNGRFVVDSVPPGEHEVVVTHPILDSLLLSLGAPAVRVVADSTTLLLLATPSLATLLGGDCPPATRALGPSAFAGRVLDADTREPAAGVRVVLVWSQLSVGSDIGVRPMPRVRTATTDARGFYRICGVPSELDDATIQAERGRAKTAEVQVSVGGAAVGLRSLLVGPAANDAHRAAIAGRIVDTTGAPLEHAQVSVEGAPEVTTSDARGEFRLDSVPSGTQALVARRIGFAPSRTIVDLAAGTTPRVALRLGRATPRLNPVVVTAQAEALSRVGFEDRQKRGMGHYLGPDDIARMQPQQVTSALRTMPGLSVVPAGGGGNTVRSSRGGGCVAYWVDGAPFQEVNPGDVDAAFAANQLAAVEVYQPSEVPPQFNSAGQSSCTTIVLWTQASIRRKR